MIDLHCHSTFSLLDGFGTPKEIVERAVKLGWGAAAITEHGWMGSAPAFYQACREYKIKPLVGCELYVTPDFALGERGKEFQKMQFHLTALALSREGYQNLCAWTTFAMQRENFYGKPRITLGKMVEVAPWPLHHNVILSGCLGSELNQMLLQADGNGLDLGTLYIEAARMLFPNFYIEVQSHKIERFLGVGFSSYEDMVQREAQVRGQLLKLAVRTNTPVVLTNDSHMQSPKQRKAHIAMKASAWRNRDDVHYGNSQEQVISGYVKDYIYYGSYMRDMEVVADGANLAPEVLENVSGIVAEANLTIEPLESFSYSMPSSGYRKPVDEIRRKSKQRLQAARKQYGRIAVERFEYELESMAGFADYLLLLADFIEGARQQGILTWTRGSAACSFLAYCLGIHEIDSIEYRLTFSRFFNPARKKLPDIDVDIDPERYDDFMQIVQERMEPLIGEGQVVQICNLGTSANRSAFRMAASALGMPKEQQDEIAKLLPQMIDEGMVGEDEDYFIALREDYPELYEISSSIFDSVKNVSQHACAWVFGTPDRPLKDWVPLYLIASSGTMVTQFDFKTIEDFGWVKGDFLRLKALSVISKTLKMIGRSPLDFYDLPLDDEPTFEMFRSGNVEGIHTVQGKEVRRGIVEMEAESVHDVILAAALWRPANTREDKDKLYLARRHGHEKVEYPHPIIQEILEPTLGVPVFQEQAMEICYALGMDDAAVDDVYQAIKKAKGAGRGAKQAFAKVRPVFMEAARKVIKNGQTRKEAWETVKAFQGYGFNKGHAASYGILGTKMGFLKRHHPTEYYAALLDTFPDKPTYLAAARSEGIQLLAPDVNRSGAGYAIDPSVAQGIRVGLQKIDGIGPAAAREIVANQSYSSLDEFTGKTTRRIVNSARVTALSAIGAFRSLGQGGKPDDGTQFQYLGFTLGKPKAMKGLKPKHARERISDNGWQHLGLEHGVEVTPYRSSVSKMFWIPPDTKLELKASPWAHVKTYLFTVLDENGIPFHLMVNEDKQFEVKLVKFLAQKCRGAVLCADGNVRLPFVQGQPQGFRFYGITGSYKADPQIWHVSKQYTKAISALAETKKRVRYA